MEKLLELLNDYEIEREGKIDLFNDKEKPLWEWYKDLAGDLTFNPTDNNKMNGEWFSGDTAHSVIISKSYGFIQRLVENDKIDEIKLSCVGTEDMQYYYSEEDILLMVLSIQDNPIQFLIDILA